MFEKLLLPSLAAVALLATAARADSITHGSDDHQHGLRDRRQPGQRRDDAGDGTTVTARVDYVYRIGKYEVSENQWDAVVAADGSDLLNDPGYWSGNQPVAIFPGTKRPCSATGSPRAM